MNRRLFLHPSLLAAAGAAETSSVAHPADGKVGKTFKKYLEVSKDALKDV